MDFALSLWDEQGRKGAVHTCSIHSGSNPREHHSEPEAATNFANAVTDCELIITVKVASSRDIEKYDYLNALCPIQLAPTTSSLGQPRQLYSKKQATSWQGRLHTCKYVRSRGPN
jgi:hypothetical protein